MSKYSTSNHEQPQRLLKIGQQQILSGQNVMMPVILRGGHGLKRLHLDISFDNTQMEFTSIQKTRQSDDFDVLIAELPENGLVRITGEHIRGIQTMGEGALLKLYFRVRGKLVPPRIIHAGGDLEPFHIE